MKKYFLYSLAVLCSACILLSCKKDKVDDKKTEAPALAASISVAQPLADSTYVANAVVDIDVTVTADFHMHGYDAYLINLTADDTVWSNDAHSHGETYHITGQWTNNVAQDSDMKLKVISTLDHDGNTSVKEVAFRCLAN